VLGFVVVISLFMVMIDYGRLGRLAALGDSLAPTRSARR
jgi:hypothetical protein